MDADFADSRGFKNLAGHGYSCPIALIRVTRVNKLVLDVPWSRCCLFHRRESGEDRANDVFRG
jgi:hypothetical protein